MTITGDLLPVNSRQDTLSSVPRPSPPVSRNWSASRKSVWILSLTWNRRHDIRSTLTVQEKCQEQFSDLYMIFVDLSKAFDTVSREGLWRIVKKFGCSDKFTTMVRQFHDGMMVKVLDDGEESKPSPVSNGVKQGCELALTLFSNVARCLSRPRGRRHSKGTGLMEHCSSLAALKL